ncbi:MAG: hypothetical protein AAGA48_22905 [Myxococcota bacterium]
MDDKRYGVQILGTHWSLRERTVRRWLKWGLLTGVELVRPEAPGAPWTRLHDTVAFAETVPHLREPGLAAHRRRLRWWFPPAFVVVAWVTVFTTILAIETPDPGEAVPLSLFFLGTPLAALALWTSWFANSFRAVFGRSNAAPETPAVVEAVAEPLEEADEQEKLRAELEVLQRLQAAASHPDRIRALKREEQALIRRMIRT